MSNVPGIFVSVSYLATKSFVYFACLVYSQNVIKYEIMALVRSVIYCRFILQIEEMTTTAWWKLHIKCRHLQAHIAALSATGILLSIQLRYGWTSRNPSGKPSAHRTGLVATKLAMPTCSKAPSHPLFTTSGPPESPCVKERSCKYYTNS